MINGFLIGIALAAVLAPIFMLLQKKCPHCESRIPLGSHPKVCPKCGRDIPQ